MRTIFFLISAVLCMVLTSFQNNKRVVLIIRPFGYGEHTLHRSDSIYIDYYMGQQAINDSIKKYVKDFSAVKTVLLAQPSPILKSIDFKPFVNMSTLILAGDDDDYIDSLKYGFFENDKLRKIILCSIYLTSGSPHKVYYSKKELKAYIKTFRPDIAVRFKPMGKYNKQGWGN
jgi:hypothetical protein